MSVCGGGAASGGSGGGDASAGGGAAGDPPVEDDKCDLCDNSWEDEEGDMEMTITVHEHIINMFVCWRCLEHDHEHEPDNFTLTYDEDNDTTTLTLHESKMFKDSAGADVELQAEVQYDLILNEYD